MFFFQPLPSPMHVVLPQRRSRYTPASSLSQSLVIDYTNAMGSMGLSFMPFEYALALHLLLLCFSKL
jgi:hypothetical protein